MCNFGLACLEEPLETTHNSMWGGEGGGGGSWVVGYTKQVNIQQGHQSTDECPYILMGKKREKWITMKCGNFSSNEM